MKKYLFVVCCLLLVFVITGCGLSDEEKEKRKLYFAQAEENAIKYIENKYGFTPKIGAKECTFDNSDSFSSNCNEEVMVSAEYNNKRFDIIIDGSKPYDQGIDNYQYDEITNDLIKLINNDFGAAYKYKFYYGLYDYSADNNEGLINLYYDGNNLSEIMEKSYLRGVVEYINGDNFGILQSKLNSLNYSLFKKLYVVNYKSLDSFKKVSTHDYCIFCSTWEDKFYDNSKYLKEVIVLFYSDIKYFDFK